MNASCKTNRASRIVALVAAVLTSTALFAGVLSLADGPVDAESVPVVALASSPAVQR
jgi:hypothetical protein